MATMTPEMETLFQTNPGLAMRMLEASEQSPFVSDPRRMPNPEEPPDFLEQAKNVGSRALEGLGNLATGDVQQYLPSFGALTTGQATDFLPNIPGLTSGDVQPFLGGGLGEAPGTEEPAVPTDAAPEIPAAPAFDPNAATTPSGTYFDTPEASLGDDAAAAEEVVGHITAADISRGGGLSQVEPEVAAPEPLTPFDESTVDTDLDLIHHDMPGPIGRFGQGMRDKLGLKDEGASKLGMALIRGGAALMSGPANFGKALGQAVNAGLDGFIEQDTSIKAEKKERIQTAMDRWKMDQQVKEANQKLALDHARFELDKQEAARARKEGTKTPMEEAIEAAQQAKTAQELGITPDEEGGFEFRYTPTEEEPGSDFGKLVDDLEDRFDLTRDEAFKYARELWTERYAKKDAGLGDLLEAP